ncbi:M23 family peptidase [Sandaracinobacter neustonicus]|uniref:M23 family peptidase n=1 Tax=Sandaracinobacter neustonicus TaxID=1715348 RepID=A0A501XKG2_9SPHN|nr:M23 family metallopeptidase [Sandaracinobacter neustonicus]TPE61060.1 M23 family peptidase [Sandaracinobacter neustonicus]
MQKHVNRAAERAAASLRSLLPERRIWIESHGEHRSIKIGTHAQLMGLGTAAMIAGWMTVSTVNGAAADQAADSQAQADLARMAAQVQALKADTAALKGTVATTAERIESRQQFLDALLTGKARGEALAELLPRTTRKVTADVAAAAGVLAPFAALEQKQLALVDKASATAETRLRDAEALIGKLGLTPGRFIAQSAGRFTRTGLGGPFIPAGDAMGGTDPRFTELFVNWQRVEQLEEAMVSLPSFIPAKSYTLTSSYGVRYDPFNGRAAQHAGLDMAGSMGEPIYAAAAGRVVRAERFGGYGLAVDIDHGRGILTRYGHLSKIKVNVGDTVAIGEVIGAMGSTGRSTGTHLHYEVRIDGRPVNPRPFLESSRYLLAYHSEKAGPELSSAQ